MFSRHDKRPMNVVMMQQPDGSMRPVRTPVNPCTQADHEPCFLCRYPKWYATLDEAGRKAEAQRIKALQNEAAAQVAAGTYRGQLGTVVRTVTVDDEPEDEAPAPSSTRAEQLQDLAYAACEAAAALAVAERTHRGLRAAKAAEKRTWAQLLTALQAA